MFAVKVGTERGSEQVEELLAFAWGERELWVELLRQGAQRALAYSGRRHSRCACGAPFTETTCVVR